MEPNEINILIWGIIFVLICVILIGLYKAGSKSKEDLPAEILDKIQNKHISRSQKFLAFSILYSISYFILIILALALVVLFIYLSSEYNFNEKIMIFFYLGFLALLIKIGLVKAVTATGNFFLIKFFSIFKENSEI